MESGCRSAGSEVAVGVLSWGEIHPPHLQPGTVESWRQSARGILSCQIRIECDKDGTVRPIGELGKLCACQVHAEGATGVDKARLPENRQIQETFHQNQVGIMVHALPGE